MAERSPADLVEFRKITTDQGKTTIFNEHPVYYYRKHVFKKAVCAYVSQMAHIVGLPECVVMYEYIPCA